MAKITYPSENAKKPVFDVYSAKPLAFKRTFVRLCNASEAVAMERHKVVPFSTYLWMAVILLSLLAYLVDHLGISINLHV